MDNDMDLMILFKNHKKHHKTLSETYDCHKIEDDALHLDHDSEEHE